MNVVKLFINSLFFIERKLEERRLFNDIYRIEILADKIHQIWAKWFRFQEEERLRVINDIPNLERWKRQSNTEYSDLPQCEKISDRKLAREIFELLDSISKGKELINYEQLKEAVREYPNDYYY
jgi:hypothetical protein